MPSITTQNIASAAAQLMSPEMPTGQVSVRETNRVKTAREEGVKNSGVTTLSATTAIDGGSVNRATDSVDQGEISSPYSDQEAADREEPPPRRPANGTGQLVNLVA